MFAHMLRVFSSGRIVRLYQIKYVMALDARAVGLLLSDALWPLRYSPENHYLFSNDERTF